MAINSIAKYQLEVDSRLQRRKRELTTIKFLQTGIRREHELAAFRRLAVPVIYSHFEGFVKETATLFLELVVHRAPPLQRLPSSFFALTNWQTFLAAEGTSKIATKVAVIEAVKQNAGVAQFSTDHIIDTKGNLKSEVLAEVFATCGIPFGQFWELNASFIDNVLLRNRNLVAHGEMAEVDESTVTECREKVIVLMEQFKLELDLAATAVDLL